MRLMSFVIGRALVVNYDFNLTEQTSEQKFFEVEASKSLGGFVRFDKRHR